MYQLQMEVEGGSSTIGLLPPPIRRTRAPSPVMQVLVRTKAVLMAHGWVRETYSTPNGFCVDGAVRTVVHAGGALWGSTMQRLQQATPLAAQGNDESAAVTVHHYNDRLQSIEQVLDWLDRAIAMEC